MDNNSGITRKLEANAIQGIARNLDAANSLLSSLSSGKFSNARETIPSRDFTKQGLISNQFKQARTTTISGNNPGASSTSGISNNPRGAGSSSIGNQFKKSVSMFDTNKDGFVSLEEAFDYLISMKQRGQQPSPRIFQASSQAAGINKSIETFDTNGNLDISNRELIDALLRLRSGEFSKDITEQIAKFVLGKLSNNLVNMEKAINLIDSKTDGKISDLEVLTTLLASRQGTVSLNDPNVNEVLKTNSNFDRLLAALNKFGNNFNGVVTDQEAFQIMLDLRKPIVDDTTIDKSLFLPFNHNIDAIDNSISLLDSQKDGQITDSEFVNVIMKMRRGELSSEDNAIVLNILDGIPKYKNIKDVIVALDSSKDGQISDDEFIDFTLGNLRNHITVDDTLVNLISQSNDKVGIIKSLINKADSDHNGDISNQEYLTALTDLENRKLSPSSHEVLNKILSRNPNHQAIEAALEFIDKDHNSIVSDDEASLAILAKYKGDPHSRPADIFDMIVDTNPHKATIETIINKLDPNKDGAIDVKDIFNLVSSFKQGQFVTDSSIFKTVLGTIPNGKETLDTYELMDTNHDNTLTLREYTAALMKIKQGSMDNPGTEVLDTFTSAITNASMVKNAIAIIDADNSGTVSAQEFVGNLSKAVMGSDGKTDLAKLAILSPLMDIIYPNAAGLDQFRQDVDANNDNIISDNELINMVLKLSAGIVTNPGQDIVDVVFSANANKDKIIDLISRIDIDHDGKISDAELATNLMKVRSGGFAADLTLVQTILSKNSNSDDVTSILNIFDPDQNGLITDIEMFLGLMAKHNSANTASFLPSVVNVLKTLNANTPAIEKLVDNIDPNNSGTVDYDELISAYLKINAGSMADVSKEIKTILPGVDGKAYGDKALVAETLLDSVDADNDGQVSNLEIANLIITNKKNNILSSYDPALVAAIFKTNPAKAQIEALINSLDSNGDGEFDDAEVTKVLLDQFKNPNIFGTNTDLVEAILSTHSSSYKHIKDLIAAIDQDRDSIISDAEASRAILAKYKGDLKTLPSNIFNTIIETNAHKADIETIINTLDPNKDGAIDVKDIFNLVSNFKKGQFIADDTLLRTVLNEVPKGKVTLDTYELMDTNHDKTLTLREYTAMLMKIKQGSISNPGNDIFANFTAAITNASMVKDAIAIIDADNSGTVSAQEFVGNLSKAVMGSDGKTDLAKLAILSPLMDLIYPNAAGLDQFRKDVDINNDNIISDNELINTAFKLNAGTMANPGEDIVDVVFSANTNKVKILNLINTIDADHDGTVSDPELTSNLMKVRSGKFTADDLGLVQAILNKNSNYNNVQATINIFDPDQNGLISDVEMFLALMAKHNGANAASFLAPVVDVLKTLNSNTSAIEKLVNNIDPNNSGTVDYDELVSAYLKINAGSMADVSKEIKRILPGTDGKAYGDKALTAETLVDTIDADADGQISNLEIANIIIANKKTNILSTYDPALVAAIFKTNPAKAEIESLINSLDSNDDGEFDDAEVTKILLDQFKNPNIFGANTDLVDAILSTHSSSYKAIKDLIATIDQDHNSVIDDTDVSMALQKKYKGDLNIPSVDIFNTILETNAHKAEIETIINTLDPNKDGTIAVKDIFNLVSSFKQGQFVADDTLFKTVLGSVPKGKATLDTYELMDANHDNALTLREYTSTLMQIRQGKVNNPGTEVMASFTAAITNANVVKDAIDITDADSNGTVSEKEFVDNFTKAITGSDGKLDLGKLAILSPLMDIIYPNAISLDQFRKNVDVNNDNTVSDNELIDMAFKLNAGTETNPGQYIVDIVFSANANKTKILDLIKTIDKDNDGAVSDPELATNLMKARSGGFATGDLSLVLTILNKNLNYNNVKSIVNIFDPDQNGLVTDIEMFLGLMAKHNSNNAASFIPSVVDALKSLNKNSDAIDKLVNSLDPNNSGTVDYDELVSAYLKINAGSMADISSAIKEVIPGANGVAYGDKASIAKTLVDSIDADHNGQVSNLEIANILISDRKNNILSSYDPALITAIFKTNPAKAEIEALLNSLDKDGDGKFSNNEVIQTLLAQAKDPSIFGTNTDLVESILSTHNNSYAHIKDLIASIDADRDGSISNLETMKSIVNSDKGLISNADKPLVDSILSSNSKLAAIKAAYKDFAINPKSKTLTQDLFGIWVNIQQGTRTDAYFSELVSALDKTDDLRALTTQFTSVDSNHDGNISQTEFGDLLVEIIKGTKNSNNYQSIIDYLIQDPAMAAVKSIVDSFGDHSDQNILTGLMGLWNPEQKSFLSTSFVQSILKLNSHSATIQKILALVDPMKAGNINNNTTVKYIDSLQIARYSTPQTDMRYDFNGNGVIDEKDYINYIAFYQYISKSNGGDEFVIE